MTDDEVRWDPEDERLPGLAPELEEDYRPVMRHLPWLLAAGLAVLTVAGMFLLRPTTLPGVDMAFLGVGAEFHRAQVEAAEVGPCQGTAPEDEVLCTTVTFRIQEGPDAGATFVQAFPESGSSPVLEPGDQVVLGHQPGAPVGFDYYFADRHRGPVLFWLALAFAGTVVVLGRLRGLAALIGLAASLLVLLEFVLPAILAGRDPVWVSVVGASAIAYLALYTAHGFTRMTTVALLGTLASLLLVAVLSTLTVDLARLSGFATEEALLLTLVPGAIDVQGLILGGIVLGALGAIDDVTVTQASAVWELRAAAPRMERSRLLRSGLRIGRDHVVSTVNTLVLAYAGASMPLLVLFVLSQQSLGIIANSELVATEIVRTLVGSIGLVAAVPITTWLAARLAPVPAEPA